MSDLKFPSAGITVLHERSETNDTTHPGRSQILQVNLVESITRDLLKSLRNHEQVRIKLGKKPAISLGKRSVSLEHGSDNFTSEIFCGPRDGSEPMYFTGTLNHTLEVQQAKQATAGSDAALATLENTLKSMQEERASNETGLVASRFSKKDHRPSPIAAKDRFLSSSGPSTPFLGSGFSPRLGPTSAPLLSPSSNKDKIRLDAIRIPMTHLLAIGPMSAKDVAEKLKISRTDCDRVLAKIARDARSSPGKWELKDKPYRSLDVWKFPYQSQNDRQAAIDHSVSAFDRMRIDKSDPSWQMLLAKEDRGKGINLSRLNFDKPITVSNATSRIPERSTDGSTEGKSTASEADGQGKRVKEAAGKTSDSAAETVSKPKPSKDTTKNQASKGSPQAKVAAKKTKQNDSDTKFKSAERIEDSDEEAEEAETLPAAKSGEAHVRRKEQTTEATITPKASSNPKSAKTASSNTVLHKPRLSNSSGSSSSDVPSTKPSSKTLKKPSEKQSQGSELTKSKVSPRPRTDSSPQKPSPLGSSPPTNFTDADNSSVSSKGASQSSAPSSPPSSTDSADTRRGNKYSPVISESKPDKMNVSKRKAEISSEQPAAKRVQVNGHRFNSLPQDLSTHIQHAQRQGSPESDNRSPEKPPLTKDEVIENARRFQKYYAKYKSAHDSLAKIPEKERDDSEVDKLWSMHRRLHDLKQEIWKDWERVES